MFGIFDELTETEKAVISDIHELVVKHDLSLEGLGNAEICYSGRVKRLPVSEPPRLEDILKPAE